MIEIGGRPILWHIMKIYASYGVREFIVCLGYRGYMVKEYFFNYFLHNADATIDIERNTVDYHGNRTEPWRVTLVDTGEETLTGERVVRARRFLSSDAPFYLTYGDGLADIDFAAQLAFHLKHGGLATMTVVRPPARFGRSVVEGDRVVKFEEKPQAATGLINGGFFVLSPKALDQIEDDNVAWESQPLERLVQINELYAWRHEGFWQPMDTLREKELLEGMWASGSPPWKVWR